MENVGIRVAMLTAGLKQYQVAAAMGITEEYFSKLLRNELPEAKQKQILAVIDQLKHKR